MYRMIPGILSFILMMPFLNGQSVVLTDVLKPDALAVSDSFLYVSEETSILIYRLSDMRFLKRFGKAGEGPMEFSRFIHLTPLGGKLWINSMGRLSVFSAMGDFIESRKSPGQFRTQVLPLGDGFIGRLMKRGENSVDLSLALFDGSLKQVRELSSLPFTARGGGPGGGMRGGSGPGAGARITFPVTPFLMASSGSHAAIAAWNGFTFLLIDENGRKVLPVERADWRSPQLTDGDKKAYEASLQRRFGSRWDRMKDRVQIADSVPALAELFFDRGDLLVATWKKENGKTLVYRYSMEGKEKDVLKLPIADQAPLERYPYCIGNDRIYQLVENEDEDWVLQVSLLK